MPSVKIYSTPHCPYCLIAKNYFQKMKIDYEDVNVEGDETMQREVFEKSGQSEVPIFEINGEIIIGFKKAKIDDLLGLK